MDLLIGAHFDHYAGSPRIVDLDVFLQGLEGFKPKVWQRP